MNFEILKPELKRKRILDVKQALAVLSANKPMYWSWGVSKLVNIENRALALKVSGHHHKGWVVVCVSGLDLYDFYLLTNKGEIKEEINDLYFDQLADAIDQKIEYIADYNR